jgi:hypothetical protein
MATPDPVVVPDHANILKMKQSAIDCLQWIDATADDCGFYSDDIERFMLHAEICDITNIIDIAKTPYSNLYDLVHNGLDDADFFDCIAPFIIDLKLLVRFLNTVVNFPQMVAQSNGNTHNAWLLVLDNVEQYQHRFHRYRRTFTNAEYETIQAEFTKDDSSTVGTQCTRRSIMMEQKQPKRALKTVFQQTPNRPRLDEGSPEQPTSKTKMTVDVPKCVTFTSNVEENTKAMLDEASYQAALTAFLNESFLTKPPVKLIVRKEMHNKIRWDGQEKTFMAFKKQYEAYLMTSLQDYATDPVFRAAYIKQDSSYFKMCLKYEVSHTQVKSDTKQQYGALAKLVIRQH